MQKKIDDLKLAIDGFITPEQANKLKIIKKHYEELASCKSNLEKVILSLSITYSEEIDLILTVPSFKNIFSAIAVISEISFNMSAFPTAKHLCSWAELTPLNSESAGKKNIVNTSGLLQL